MIDPAEMISALALLHVQQLQSPPDRAGGAQDDPGYCLDDDEAVTDKCRRKAHPKTGPPEALDALAYTTVQAARVTGRSHTRIKLAIRNKEITALKDGRATLIERAELRRWLATLPTIGRKPDQETAPVAAKNKRPPPPPPRQRSIARSDALENNPRRPRKILAENQPQT